MIQIIILPPCRCCDTSPEPITPKELVELYPNPEDFKLCLVGLNADMLSMLLDAFEEDELYEHCSVIYNELCKRRRGL